MGKASISIGALLALSACTLGPNYTRPPSVAEKAVTRGNFLRGGDAVSAAPVARWWDVLGDPVLTELIDRALAQSPDMAATGARIEQARAGLSAYRTTLRPRVGSTLAAPYISLPAGSLGIREDDRIEGFSYTAGFDASWELDLFGSNRRQIQAATARTAAIEATGDDARVSLSAEVARAYVALRLRQQMALSQAQQAEIDNRLIALMRQRVSAGTAPMHALSEMQAQRAHGEGELAQSRAETTVLMDQIAALVGQEPGSLDTILAPPAPIPLPPAELAVGDPAALLRNRPDIRRAERQLAAATADIGVKAAERFPKISFMGLLGLGGPRIGDVFDSGSIVSAAIPRLRWTLFDGGQVAADVRRANSARDEAEANYRRTIITALQDAENSLTRFGAQRTAYAWALDADKQAGAASSLQTQRADAGAISQMEGLAAKRRTIDVSLAAAAARANLTTSFVAVEKALGIGWDTLPKAP